MTQRCFAGEVFLGARPNALELRGKRVRISGGLRRRARSVRGRRRECCAAARGGKIDEEPRAARLSARGFPRLHERTVVGKVAA